jgi:hypothetical protein
MAPGGRLPASAYVRPLSSAPRLQENAATEESDDFSAPARWGSGELARSEDMYGAFGRCPKGFYGGAPLPRHSSLHDIGSLQAHLHTLDPQVSKVLES